MKESPTQTLFPNIVAFYELRGGAYSGELDFGVWWNIGPVKGIRVSLVHETGDVYAAGRQLVGLIGTIPTGFPDGLDAKTHDPERKAPCKQKLCSYAVADRLLDGYANVIHLPNSLAWVRERLDAAGMAHPHEAHGELDRGGNYLE